VVIIRPGIPSRVFWGVRARWPGLTPARPAPGAPSTRPAAAASCLHREAVAGEQPRQIQRSFQEASIAQHQAQDGALNGSIDAFRPPRGRSRAVSAAPRRRVRGACRSRPGRRFTSTGPRAVAQAAAAWIGHKLAASDRRDAPA